MLGMAWHEQASTLALSPPSQYRASVSCWPTTVSLPWPISGATAWLLRLCAYCLHFADFAFGSAEQHFAVAAQRKVMGQQTASRLCIVANGNSWQKLPAAQGSFPGLKAPKLSVVLACGACLQQLAPCRLSWIDAGVEGSMAYHGGKQAPCTTSRTSLMTSLPALST